MSDLLPKKRRHSSAKTNYQEISKCVDLSKHSSNNKLHVDKKSRCTKSGGTQALQMGKRASSNANMKKIK